MGPLHVYLSDLMEEVAMFQRVGIGILVITLVSLPMIAQGEDAAEQAFMDVK